MAKKEIHDYLANMENPKSLKKKKGLLFANSEYLKENMLKDYRSDTSHEVNSIIIDGKQWYFKSLAEFLALRKAIDMSMTSELVVARLYNKMGITTAKTFPLLVEIYPRTDKYVKSRILDKYKDTDYDIGIITSDLNGIPGVEVESLSKVYPIRKLIRDFCCNGGTRREISFIDLLRYKDDILDFKRKNGSSLITKSAFCDFIDILGGDGIVGQTDRNYGNVFLCREEGSESYDGAIAIDNERTILSNNARYGLEKNPEEDVVDAIVYLDNEDETLIEKFRVLRKLYLSGIFEREDKESFIHQFLKVKMNEIFKDVEATGYKLSKFEKESYRRIVEDAQNIIGG